MVDAGATRSFVRKPPWLSRAAFDELIQNHGGIPRCAVTGSTDDLSIDHIVPRYLGGTDDVSNLQFLVTRINAKKGIRPDPYWSQRFYWDQTPNLDAFRTAQRELFQTVIDEPWFRRPISQIARQLYVNAWVVGAGKTLGIAATAWAMNHVIRNEWGDAPRADRILVITKEQAIRDQLAADLKRDLVDYKIMSTPPRVAVIDKSYQLSQTDWLDSHDIIVTCAQMLWERGEANQETNTKVAETLAGFRVIAFDEPHFAADQVRRLVDLATQSVCFGFTGTPIDGAGTLLQKMVALKVYDYDAAVINDRSLRWLDSRPELFPTFVRELDITEAELIEFGQRGTTNVASRDGYGHNIEPAKSVVRAVIEEMKLRDQLVLSSERLAQHRSEADASMGLTYPAHGMIVCDDVPTARTLCRNQNKIFDKNPAEYPRSEGWHAEVIHTDGKDSSGDARGAKPLTNEHPWLRSKNINYAIDDRCSRLLFVVGMAREGVNNPACGPIGVASAQKSLVEWVQRAIGRQLRAVTQLHDGILLAPPEPLDSVRIITHKAFQNKEIIQRAFDFVCDMENHLDKLPTIAELDDYDSPLRDPQDRDFVLTQAEKIKIAGRLGEADENGVLPTIECVVNEIVGEDDDDPATNLQRQRVGEWAKKVQEDPAAARRELRLKDTELAPRLIVTREHVKDEPSDDDLARHLTIHQSHLVGQYVPIQDEHRALLTALYMEHAKRFYLPPLDSEDNVDILRKGIAQKVLQRLGSYYEGANDRDVYLFVGAAVKHALGTKEVVSIKSNWDTPQVHAMLRRGDVQSDIVGWTIDRLIDKGLCPALATFLRKSTTFGTHYDSPSEY